MTFGPSIRHHLLRWFATLAFGLILLAAMSAPLQAQSATLSSNQILGLGYSIPKYPVASPGQVITVFTPLLGVPDAVATQANPLPTNLSGVSVSVRPSSLISFPNYPQSLAILRVFSVLCPQNGVSDTYCPVSAVTVQIPATIGCVTASSGTCTIFGPPPQIILNVNANGQVGPDMPVTLLPGSQHLLSSCDTIFGNLPATSCAPVVTHGDGSLVGQSSPAHVGEEIVVYMVGAGVNDFGGNVEFAYIGTANPLQQQTVFVDYLTPAYIGPSGGAVGLAQMNLVVPPLPPGALTCTQSTALGFFNAYISTTTETDGRRFICVVP